jgi:hypothetical protein
VPRGLSEGFGTICIGKNCEYQLGEPPTGFDGDDIVDLKKDKMSGSLNVSRVEDETSGTVCIGNSCDRLEGRDDYKGHLGQEGYKDKTLDGPLFVNHLLPRDGNLCMGNDCTTP